MATPKQPPPSQQPKPSYSEALQEAISEFNSALASYNEWTQGYGEICRNLYVASAKMRALGVMLPAMPGERFGAPPPPVDVDAEIRDAIKKDNIGVSPIKGPRTDNGPKTSKE